MDLWQHFTFYYYFAISNVTYVINMLPFKFLDAMVKLTLDVLRSWDYQDAHFSRVKEEGSGMGAICI